jgi:hypothetical protein
VRHGARLFVQEKKGGALEVQKTQREMVQSRQLIQHQDEDVCFRGSKRYPRNQGRRNLEVKYD